MADVLNKDMPRNVSRIRYASLTLSQEQGILLKLFLVTNRVRLLGSPAAHPHPKLNLESTPRGISRTSFPGPLLFLELVIVLAGLQFSYKRGNICL